MNLEDLKSEIKLKIRNNTIRLPSLPYVICKIEQKIEDDNSSINSIADLIQKDMTTCSRILQVSNSPALRARSKITSVKEAVGRIGLNMVKNIIMMITLRDLFKTSNDNLSEFLLDTFKRSIHLSHRVTKFCIRNPKVGFKTDIVNFAGIIFYLGRLPVIDYYSEKSSIDINEVIENSNCLRDYFNQVIVKQWSIDYDLANAITRNSVKPLTQDIGNLLYATDLYLEKREDMYDQSDKFMKLVWTDLKENETDDTEYTFFVKELIDKYFS
jgi:HD-like signal output (HDOD) protein